MTDNVIPFPRKPDPDVVYTAVKEFEPTAGGHLISVCRGRHRNGGETLAILMIMLAGSNEEMFVLAEWPEGQALPSDAIAIAEIVHRAVSYAVEPVDDDRDGGAA